MDDSAAVLGFPRGVRIFRVRYGVPSDSGVLSCLVVCCSCARVFPSSLPRTRHAGFSFRRHGWSRMAVGDDVRFRPAFLFFH